MTEIFNKFSEKEKRQHLRNNITKAESILWSKLRGRQILNCKLRRQYSVDSFVIDFYSPQIKLAIEVDGDSHFTDDAQEYDQERQAFIENFGIVFLRFTNDEVYYKLDAVLEVIVFKVKELTPPQPSPYQGEGADFFLEYWEKVT